MDNSCVMSVGSITLYCFVALGFIRARQSEMASVELSNVKPGRNETMMQSFIRFPPSSPVLIYARSSSGRKELSTSHWFYLFDLKQGHII